MTAPKPTLAEVPEALRINQEATARLQAEVDSGREVGDG